MSGQSQDRPGKFEARPRIQFALDQNSPPNPASRSLPRERLATSRLQLAAPIEQRIARFPLQTPTQDINLAEVGLLRAPGTTLGMMEVPGN